MPGEAVAVEVEGLTRTFGAFRAVDGISFSVAAGEIFGFLGPNGAGKSTTIKMLCGILAPTAGRAVVGGFDVARDPAGVRGTIGYMSQRFSLYEDLRVIENLEFFGGVQSLAREHLRARIQRVLELANLEAHRGDLAANLSGGIRQRLAVACAIIHEPRIVFLDEPTAGVDPSARRNFWELIYELAGAGVTVFVSTHYMDEAEHCDRLALIHRGRIVASGSPNELKTTALRESILEVEATDLVRLLETASSLPTVVDVTLYGNRLHVMTRDADRTRAELARAAADRGLEITALEAITPSLEDVFVALLEDRA